jgi:hypothetical protein
MSSGSLKVLGNITVTGLATFLSDVHVQGELVLSNRQAGFAVIPQTGTAVTIRFTTQLSGTPVMTATPQGRVGTEWWIENATMTGFTIRLDEPAKLMVRFSWTAITSTDPLTTMGTGALTGTQAIPFPVDALGRPFSLTNPVWTACIQGRQVLDPSGVPFSCSRYHQDFAWEHPDLHVSFTYNPNQEPPVLTLPPGYEVVNVGSDQQPATSNQPTSTDSTSSSVTTPTPVSVTATGSSPVTDSGSTVTSPSDSGTGTIVTPPATVEPEPASSAVSSEASASSAETISPAASDPVVTPVSEDSSSVSSPTETSASAEPSVPVDDGSVQE